MSSFKMTVGAGCAVSTCSHLLPFIKALAQWLSVVGWGWGGVGLWTGVHPSSPYTFGSQNPK